MVLWVVFAVLLCVASTQELICSSSKDLIPPTGRPRLATPQKVLYVNILPGYDGDMYLGFTKLRDIVLAQYPGSTVDFHALNPSSPVVPNLDSYTQIWVADLAPYADTSSTQMASYQKIANWYLAQGTPHVILDGRWISSIWSNSVYGGNAFRPNVKLIENYFVNLAVRGGGIALLTDHAEDFTRGINEINRLIGVGAFYGYFYASPFLMQIDHESPLFTYPNDPSHHNSPPVYNIFDDSSTAYTPVNVQRNGVILYPAGWHGLKGGDNPGISTTIRGNIGFLIDITSPTCGGLVAGGRINFTAKIVKGGTGAITWSWVSSNGGTFSNVQNPTWDARPGFHVVTVTAKDTQNFIAKATVSFRVEQSSKDDNGGLGANGDGTCYFVKREGKGANEVFPITRSLTPVAYYGLKAGTAVTPDGIEKNPRAFNVYLYTDSKTMALEVILSNPTITSGLTLGLKGTGLGTATTLSLKNDLSDTINWTPATQTGNAVWSYKLDTKGFVIEGLPIKKGLDNNWCIDMTLSKALQLDFVSDFGHTKSSAAVPNPNPIYYTQYDIQYVPSISFCRATCFVPTVPLTGLFGTFGPIQVNFLKGTGGTTYNDNAPSSWVIKPSSGAGAGIGVSFINTYDVASGDGLTIYNGEKDTAPVAGTPAAGKTAPTPIKVAGSTGMVSWKPNNNGVVGAGWTAFYAVIPTATTLSPISGPQRSHTMVTITGTNFVKTGRNVVKFGSGIVITDQASIFVDSPTSMRVNVPPPGLQGMKQFIVDVEVSNDGVFFAKVPQKFTFFEGTCKDISTCTDCFNIVGCTWCGVNSEPTKSFCFTATDNSCPVDLDHKTENDCSDAPDFSITVQEGSSLLVTFIKKALLDKVTQVKISGSFKGNMPSLNKSTGILTVNAKGQAIYGATVYLTGTNNLDKFTYEISGPGIKDSGIVTVIVTPVSKAYLEELMRKDLQDECKTGEHNCQQLCVDGTPTGGNYTCGCNPGYKIVKNRFCEDINECEGTSHGCQFNCTNLPGSFKCECNWGYARDAAGVCKALPCPLTAWKAVTISGDKPATIQEGLPSFTGEATSGTLITDWKKLPGASCYSCEGDIEKRREIDHSKWNGSPNCAADYISLVSKDICGFPCKPKQDITLGLDAIQFLYGELTKWEWLQKTMLAVLGVTAFEEEPYADKTFDEMSVFFNTCDPEKLEKGRKLIEDVVADTLPQFFNHGQISVVSTTEADGRCAVHIDADDLNEECPEDGKVCWACDGIEDVKAKTNTHPLCSTQTCGYPCAKTHLFYGANAAQYFYKEVTRNDWLKKGFKTLWDETIVLSVPEDIKERDFMWNDFYVDFVDDCTDEDKEKATETLMELLKDVLPEFDGWFWIENVDDEKCRLRVVVDDIPDKTYSIGQTAGIAVGAAAAAGVVAAALAALAGLLGGAPATTDYVAM